MDQYLVEAGGMRRFMDELSLIGMSAHSSSLEPARRCGQRGGLRAVPAAVGSGVRVQRLFGFGT
ncbi:hypothetical protein GCM10027262_46020 [Nocardia tengchongensis]